MRRLPSGSRLGALEQEAGYALRALGDWPARYTSTRAWLCEHLDVTAAELSALRELCADGELTLPQAYRVLKLVADRA